MIKRTFDLFTSLILLLFFSIFIIVFWGLSSVIFKKNGFFLQKRIGKKGNIFTIIKIRTLFSGQISDTNKYGDFLRKYKIDELPQLLNILIGNMSFVGPRPELKCFYKQDDVFYKDLVSLKPGLTGLASVYFIDEQIFKTCFSNQETFESWMIKSKNNFNVIYLKNKNLCFDIKIIYITIIKIFTIKSSL